MFIDLHDLTVNEAIKKFIEEYNKLYKKGYRSEVEVIHGYGSSGKGGKIKRSFKTYSDSHKKYFKVSYNSNPGITLVTPLKKLPLLVDKLAEEIINYCSDTPKSLSKIEGKLFKEYSSKEIKSSVKSLVKKGQLKEILKKRETVYIKGEI